MIIGVPKEIKNNEFRVALTPNNLLTLAEMGHKILIQAGAGEGSGFSDDDYISKGGKIVSSLDELYKKSELILKVKEPLESEYSLFKENQIVFTYFHFASNKQLLKAMISRKIIGIAYETVENGDGSLPLLAPMSEIGGKVSVLSSLPYLTKPYGGMGKLVSASSGIRPCSSLVIGAGVAGLNAAKMLAGVGANVYLLEIDNKKIRELSNILPKNIMVLKSSKNLICNLCREVDILVGAVLIPGHKAPKIVSKEMVASMKKLSIIIDISIDQGGCVETSKPTTHSNPTFKYGDIIHYCVTNIPGIVPKTSTEALSNATIDYIIEIANKGIDEAIKGNESLKKGLNIYKGEIVNKAILS